MEKVKLKACTEVVGDSEMTIEDFVAYCARVSNPANQENTETAPKLLRYLITNAHWSPFEMVSLTMEINTTRDIARQILRHRSFSFQEFSQRYADPTRALDFSTREMRMQDFKNRQNSIEVELANNELNDVWNKFQEDLIKQSRNVYEWAVKNGIAKEQARAVLPEGLTLSRIYMAGTLRSWIHYCQLRCGNGTQKEHREIAEACRQILISKFPSLANLI
jgi:thymidylate synthase (FAD)